MLIKLAQDNSAKKLMGSLVAFLRALYQIHQNAHWRTKGNEFYGNHLLFQRLYEGTQETTDEAAEKTIGLFGSLPEMEDQIAALTEKFHADNFDGDWVQAALKAEQTFQALCKTVYDKIKKLEAMTLGLDDMIMSIASRHEVHIYLLKQALEGVVKEAQEKPHATLLVENDGITPVMGGRTEMVGGTQEEPELAWRERKIWLPKIPIGEVFRIIPSAPGLGYWFVSEGDIARKIPHNYSSKLEELWQSIDRDKWLGESYISERKQELEKLKQEIVGALSQTKLAKVSVKELPKLNSYKMTDAVFCSKARSIALNELFKAAQATDPEVEGPNVRIEPMESLVQQAVNRLKQMDPNYFKGVRSIVIASQPHYGFVESGPEKDPTIIHLNYNRIKQEISSKGGSDEDVINSIMETIAHEKGHVASFRPEHGFVGGEQPAEQEAQRIHGLIQPRTS